MELSSDNDFLPRAATPAVQHALRASPVVVVLGARQTGKTTLVRSMPQLAKRPYLTLDDFDLRAQAAADPEAVVERAPALVIDEVQRARDLLIAVKRAVDQGRKRTPGRFVLTGSANLLMMEQVGETLAGRATYVTLWPFARRERLGLGRAGIWSELVSAKHAKWREVIEGHSGPSEDWRVAASLGGFPVPVHEMTAPDVRATWFAGYVQTYLERDLQALRAVESLTDFRRLMRAACLRIGCMLNQTELGRDVGIGQSQVHRFMGLMETSFQAIRLNAYSVNRTKRLIKAPKLYWCDTALAMHLAGESEPRGEHLENLVLMDLVIWRDTQAHRPEVLYWRTTSGEEVDFVIETPSRTIPIEVKPATRVSPSDARGLESFLNEYADSSDGGLMLYGGTETYPLTSRILAVPWWRVC